MSTIPMRPKSTPAATPVPDLGPLLNAAEIAERCYYGKCAPRWAREEMLRLIPNKVVVIGRVKHWYEADVRHAIAASRGPG